MSDIVSSDADDGLDRNGAADEAPAPLRTAATALLSPADIWSTGPGAAAAPPVSAKPLERPKTPEETPEEIPENAAAGRTLSPSQLLAFFRPAAAGERRPTETEPASQAVEPGVAHRPVWPP